MKNTIKITMFLAYFLISIILSCTDPAPKSTPKKSVNLKTREEKTDAIYQKYIHEKSICPKFVEIIATDSEFIKSFERADYRERNELRAILSSSKVAKSEVVQYVIKHIDYFLIDFDCHGGAGFIYVKDSCVFCTQTDKRLIELEALGASEKSWEVRREFLDLELEDLSMHGMPWHEGPVLSNFGSLRFEFNKAKKLYTGQKDRQRLKEWVNKASLFLKEQTKYAQEGAAGLTKEQQIEEINIWINALKEDLN
jgi:hypothetical protein